MKAPEVAGFACVVFSILFGFVCYVCLTVHNWPAKSYRR